MSTEEYTAILDIISEIDEKFRNVSKKQRELNDRMDKSIKDTERVINLSEAATAKKLVLTPLHSL